MIKHIRIVALAFVAAGLAACSTQGSSSQLVPGASQPEAQRAGTATTMPHVRAVCPPVDPASADARCFALVRTDVWYAKPPVYSAHLGVSTDGLSAAASAADYGPLGPAQIQQAYNLPSKTGGKGQTVAVVDAYDDPTAESDLAAFRKAFKLPVCSTANGCFKKLNENGNASPLPAPDKLGWAGEMSLDLDMVSSVCPNCNIVLIEATTQNAKDLAKGVTAAAGAGANAISNSYGISECMTNSHGKVLCYDPTAYAPSYNVTKAIVTASTGDSSWFAGPQWPASFGTVVAVGGTSIYPFANSRGWLESAWTGGGSSCSHYEKSPSWAGKSICKGNMRAEADVSAVADPYTGVLVYQTYPAKKGGFSVYGGTSASSPIVAAIYALAGNASTQNFGAKLYNGPKGSLTDVVIGKNGVVGYLNSAGDQCDPYAICSAIPGYDGPTGNGTPWGTGAF